ncbi:MAG: hypothetical protein WB975_09450, partial [Nitrososphaeraceae archaeon]
SDIREWNFVEPDWIDLTKGSGTRRNDISYFGFYPWDSDSSCDGFKKDPEMILVLQVKRVS